MAAGRCTYEFGDFRLDAAQRLLLLKSGARALPLTSRAFDTLLYMVERPGQLLSKATLMKAVWPDVVVEENSLNQNISLLRRVLGESPGEYRFIVTVPGRGYRFVAEVRTINESADESPRSERAAAGTGETLRPPMAAHARTPIAILPFANLTGDPATDYLGEAMAEELTNTFARVQWFEVVSRTSAFAFKDRNLDVRKIARDLDVEAVLEGSIRRVGERIRVAAQLVDGRTGHHLWSESYERGCEDLAKVQDELTIAIVDGTTSHCVRKTRRKTPTRDLEAYHLYLEAVALRAQPTEDNLESAIQILDRALVRDPDFARAWYAIAETRAHRAANGGCTLNLLSDAERDARHALALDSSISRAHGVLGLINACCGRWIEAETELRRAVSLVARNPEALVSHAVYVARQAGHQRKALTEIQLAHELAPASPAPALHMGTQKLLEGESAEASRWIDLAVANGYPRTLSVVREARAQLALREGRFAEAAQELTETLSPASRETGGFEAIQCFFRARSDPSHNAEAIAALLAWEVTLRSQDLDLYTAQRLMTWFTMLGEIETAHDVAQRTVDRLESYGTIGTGWGMLWAAEMHPFRDSPRFQELIARLGLINYWRQYGPPDNSALRGDLLIGSP